MIDECAREAEVIEAVMAGRLLGPGAGELGTHVASCGVCREVAVVAGTIQDDFANARTEAVVPSAGHVWWRAQLRARQHLAETAGRPITCVQVVAGVLAGCALFTMGGLMWPWLRASAGWIDHLSLAADTGRVWLPLALAVGASLLVAPVAFIFMLSDE